MAANSFNWTQDFKRPAWAPSQWSAPAAKPAAASSGTAFADVSRRFNNPNAQLTAAAIQADAQRAVAATQAAANRYGNYASGIGGIGQSLANDSIGRSSALGMSEAARQAALGGIGSAALGAFGGAANNALGAWAANQTAYNKAASDMQASNQQGMSQFGSTRNAALSGLGQSYADMAGRLAGANAISGLSFGMSGSGDGGFTASGSSGPISSGTTGGGSGGSSNPFLSSVLGRGFGGLDSLQSGLMSGDITGSLNSRAAEGQRQLDQQHNSSRMMPSQMLEQARSGLQGLGGDAYGQSAMGMDQFYRSLPPESGLGRYQSLLEALTQKF
jgi:hypothetical protein